MPFQLAQAVHFACMSASGEEEDYDEDPDYNDDSERDSESSDDNENEDEEEEEEDEDVAVKQSDAYQRLPQEARATLDRARGIMIKRNREHSDFIAFAKAMEYVAQVYIFASLGLVFTKAAPFVNTDSAEVQWLLRLAADCKAEGESAIEARELGFKDWLQAAHMRHSAS